jgi:hypothetical protein
MKLHLLFLLNSFFIYSQVVCDNSTKLPVSYATIIYFNNENPTHFDYTTIGGNFLIDKNKIHDSIEISHLSYEKIKININQIKDTIFLNNKVIELNEVIVYPRKLNIKQIGLINTKQKRALGNIKGIEICMFFENQSNEDKKIKSFLLELSEKKKIESAVRFHIYSKDNNQFQPHFNLLKTDIILNIAKNSKGVIEFDLDEHNLFLPSGGAFIGIEFLSNLSKEVNNEPLFIKINSSTEKANTFGRNVLKNYWNNLDYDFRNILQLKSEKCFNVNFGLKLYE